MQREYCKKCSKCRERAVVIATVPHEFDMNHDGKIYRVSIPNLAVPQCAKCGNISFDHEADEQIDRAFRGQAGLMQPEQIREQREKLGLTQQEVADSIDVQLDKYCGWETGTLIPMRSQDRFLRAFFRFPELRAFLAQQPTPATSNGVVRSEEPIAQAVA